MIAQIKTESTYRDALAHLDTLLKKGFSALSQNEMNELEKITQLIKAYEDIHYPTPIEPKNLIEMIELRMFQQHLNQKLLSQLLGVTETRVSEILKGKRKINVEFAKKLYERLEIDADFILRYV